jgi:hypothetical protein
LDRTIVSPVAEALDTDILQTNKNAMVGLGQFMLDVLGSATCVGGLACTATTPASLAVSVGPGRIYSLQNVDNTAYGSLPPDARLILKQGSLSTAATLACPAPAGAGLSINYLIQAAYQDSDGGQAVVPYFNSANPIQPFQGPLNNGLAQPTVRQGLLVVQAKAGVAAASGTQSAPAADAGFVGLYSVTVAHGQATVTAANIAILAAAPFMGLQLGTRSIFGIQGLNTLSISSGNSATTGISDLVVSRPAGSTANIVGCGPNLYLNDPVTNSNSLIQNSGGQTEFWQFNAGAWRQWMKVSSAGLVTVPAAGSIGSGITIFGPTVNGSTIATLATSVSVAGQSFGVQLKAGTNANDYNLLLQNFNGSTNYFEVSGAGGVIVGSPGGGDQGVGTINANAFFVNGANLITTVETFATNAANTAQANAISTAAADATTKANNAQAAAISTAETFATGAANAAQANAISTAETYANGTATAEGWKAPAGGLIVKGGVATMQAASPGTLVTFGTAFPNACLSVVIVAFGGNATSAVLDKSTAGFHGINGAGTQCTWIAIGT